MADEDLHGDPLFTDRDEEYMNVLLSVAKKWSGERPESAEEGLRVMATALVGMSLQKSDQAGTETGLPKDQAVTEVVSGMITKARTEGISDALEFLNQNIHSTNE